MIDLFSYILGKKAGGGGGGDEPTGTVTITTNGTHNVKQYASALVNVPAQTLPSIVGEEF